MQTKSRPVISNQPHLHPRLAVIVRRHLAAAYRRPVAAHSRLAYESVTRTLAEKPRPLVLDSFCGTGQSTAELARQFPGHLVIGVDKSAQRLSRHVSTDQQNYCLVQANCEDIWQLMVAAGLRVDHHFLLYPNPWPKASHLRRRVHGHGSLPLLLQLGGELTLRSNWQTYVEEFGVTMHLAGVRGVVGQVPPGAPLTLFERKYRDSGHRLWQFSGRVRASGAP